MPEQRKIRSVTELAKYRVGDVAWWIIMRPCEDVEQLPENDEWMEKHHPKAYYSWGPGKALWNKAALPKLQHIDFKNMMSLLTSRVLIEQFPICDILRSRDTGEFFYSNDDDEWMPESMLMTNHIIATREKRRVFKLLQKWIDSNK